MCQSSRVKIFISIANSTTGVLVTSRPPCLCPTEGHKHGASIQSFINLGDTLLRIARDWKTAESWFLARFCILELSIICQILEFVYWMVTILSFDQMTGENREYCCLHSFKFICQWRQWLQSLSCTSYLESNSWRALRLFFWYYGKVVLNVELVVSFVSYQRPLVLT